MPRSFLSDVEAIGFGQFVGGLVSLVTGIPLTPLQHVVAGLLTYGLAVGIRHLSRRYWEGSMRNPDTLGGNA
jgi:hypothetical protein